MVATWLFTLLAIASLASATTTRTSKLTPLTPVFDGSVLNEIVSVFFNNGGYTISGRGGLTKANVDQHVGITRETDFKNGGLTFGRGSTGYFSVGGVDLRDPVKFTPCPTGKTATWNGATVVCDGTALDLAPHPSGIMAKFTVNFGNYSQICQICEHSGTHTTDKQLLSGVDGAKDWFRSTNCDGQADTLAVSGNTPQVLFSVPVEGNAGNLYLTVKRNTINRSELKNGCDLDSTNAFYTFALGSGGKQVAKWNVYKYHGIYLEDGMDHTFVVTIPRLKVFNQETIQQWPLLYIDGQYICAEHPSDAALANGFLAGVINTDYPIHCKDLPSTQVPNPTIQQELSNKKCRLTRLYLGNAPVIWNGATETGSSQPTGFRKFAGLAGATFKSFQMWNFHGIAEPSSMRLCSEKNSKQCSWYTASPWCRWTSGSSQTWKSTNPPFYTTITTSACVGTTRTWLNCPINGNTNQVAGNVGSTANCAFPGSGCTGGQACALPGVCVPNN